MLVTGGFFFAFMSIALLVMLVLSHRYVEVIENCLSNCLFVQVNRRHMAAAGLVGVFYRVLMAINILMMPGIFIKRGLADPLDIKNFPRLLRRKLLISMFSFLASAIPLFTLAAIHEHSDWVR